MQQFLRTIAHIFQNKDSRLHVVYFIDHNRTRSLSLSRGWVLTSMAALAIALGSLVGGGIFLNQQTTQNHQLLELAQATKEKLLSYQLRYDDVWMTAYPDMPTPEHEEVAASEPSTAAQATASEPAAAVIAEKTAPPKEAALEASTPEPNQPAEIAVAEPEAVPAIANHKSTTTTESVVAPVTTPVAPAQFDIKLGKLAIKREDAAFAIDFDLWNRHPKKAKGLFWAKMQFQQGDQTVIQFSHIAAADLGSSGKPDRDIPTFSVNKYRRCHLRVPLPNSAAIPISAEIIISDRTGQRILSENISIPRAIAGEAKPKKSL